MKRIKATVFALSLLGLACASGYIVVATIKPFLP